VAHSERISVLISGKIISVSKERARKMGLKEMKLLHKVRHTKLILPIKK